MAVRQPWDLIPTHQFLDTIDRSYFCSHTYALDVRSRIVTLLMDSFELYRKGAVLAKKKDLLNH